MKSAPRPGRTGRRVTNVANSLTNPRGRNADETRTKGGRADETRTPTIPEHSDFHSDFTRTSPNAPPPLPPFAGSRTNFEIERPEPSAWTKRQIDRACAAIGKACQKAAQSRREARQRAAAPTASGHYQDSPYASHAPEAKFFGGPPGRKLAPMGTPERTRQILDDINRMWGRK